MAIKTFTAGTVLTASDTNTYLTNAGLVYITQAVAGGAATSLSINNCFTTTYENYRITIDYFQPSLASRGLLMRMRVGGVDATGADYIYALPGIYSDGSSSNTSSTGTNQLDTGVFNSSTAIAVCSSVIDLFAPYKAERTMMNISSMLYNSQFGSRVGIGEHNLLTAYDGFTLFTSGAGANITNLRVKVYGYRSS